MKLKRNPECVLICSYTGSFIPFFFLSLLLVVDGCIVSLHTVLIIYSMRVFPFGNNIRNIWLKDCLAFGLKIVYIRFVDNCKLLTSHFSFTLISCSLVDVWIVRFVYSSYPSSMFLFFSFVLSFFFHFANCAICVLRWVA